MDTIPHKRSSTKTSNPQNKYLLHSRLMVKHLPAHITTDRLRAVFDPYGDITDVKVMRTRDGVSRGFGFVGFKTNKSAKKAIKGLDGTYIDLNRVHVTFAKPFEADDMDRPWSKHSKGSSRYERQQKEAMKKRQQSGVIGRSGGDDDDGGASRANSNKQDTVSDELQEYLGLSRSQGAAGRHQFWANDMAAATETATAPEAKQRRQHKKHRDAPQGNDGNADANDESISDGDGDGGDDVAMMDRRSAKRQRRAGIIGQDTTSSSDTLLQNQLRNEKVFSDMDYLRSRMTDEVLQSDENNDDDDDNIAAVTTTTAAAAAGTGTGTGTSSTTWAGYEGEVGSSADVMDTGRIFLVNLPFDATEEDIIELCKRFGELTEVHIPINTQTKQSRGVAFVTFLIPEHAKKAMDSLHTSIFMGRMIHVVPAKPMPESNAGSRQRMDTTSYKKKLEMKQRLQAQSTHNWNTLYLNKDAVLEQTSRALQVSKSELLLDGSSNTAVRMAIGETELLKSTKEILEEAGIDLSSINIVDRTPTTKSVIINNPNRSKTCILVKNLPPDTTEREIEDLFADCGDLKNVMLINQVLALVEFLEPTHARKAFRTLAYTKFKHVPLYLEWAPIKQQEEEASNKQQQQQQQKKKRENVVEKDGVRMLKKEQLDSTGISTAGKESATLFIKNLNFSTTEDGLRSFVVQCVRDQLDTQQSAEQFVRKVTVAQRKGKSAGFAFVEFSNLKIAKLVLDNCQGRPLDGHALHMQYANIEKKPESATETIDGGELFFVDKEGRAVTFKKLAVKNVAFEVTRQDLYQLFGTYGVVKEIRLPQKVSGGHRGFAFVEFASAKECHAAFDALKNTHLYGRRLVLEFAADESEENVQLQQSRQQKRMTQGYGKKRKRNEMAQ